MDFDEFMTEELADMAKRKMFYEILSRMRERVYEGWTADSTTEAARALVNSVVKVCAAESAAYTIATLLEYAEFEEGEEG